MSYIDSAAIEEFEDIFKIKLIQVEELTNIPYTIYNIDNTNINNINNFDKNAMLISSKGLNILFKKLIGSYACSRQCE